jgi:NAD(P)H-hydrate epimerase
MEPLLTAEAMSEADRFAIEEYGIPSFTLMETAGRRVAGATLRRYGSDNAVLCLCGKGNNGGDGLVVARRLYQEGASVRVVMVAPPGEMSEDTARNAALLQQLDEQAESDRLTLNILDNANQLDSYPAPDLIVDALLGTGLTSELRSPVREIAVWTNRQSAPTVAVDVPTGLHSDTGQPLGEAVRADLTVSMAALKAGLVVGKGPDYAGDAEAVEIGIPRFALERAAREHGGCARMPSSEDARARLPERDRDAHKYTAGLALVAAGAPGMTGAPVMASSAAARVGAGAVVCACAEDIQPTLAAKMTEVMTEALPTTEGGGIASRSAVEALHDRLDNAGSLLVGPGLGRAPDTERFVRALLRAHDGPAVIDADGLNALSDHTGFLSEHAAGRWVLTPHEGEFKRLAGEEADLTDRLRTAQTFAARWNCVLLLKGAPSLVAAPDSATYVNAPGGPALATAGTGDVLAGLTAGLLAQGLEPLPAAACALHLGGAAADRFAARRHPNALLATDLLGELPDVMRDL